MTTTDTAAPHGRRITPTEATARVDELLAPLCGYKPTNHAERLAATQDLGKRYELIGSHRDTLLRAVEHIRVEAYRLAYEDLQTIAMVVAEQRRNAPKPTPAKATGNAAALFARSIGLQVEGNEVRSLIASQLVAIDRAHSAPTKRFIAVLAGEQPPNAEARRLAAVAWSRTGAEAHVPELRPSAADWLEGLPRVQEQRDLPRWLAQLAAILGVATGDVAAALERIIAQRANVGDFLRAYWARELRIRVSIPGTEMLGVPDEMAAAHAIGVLRAADET